MSALEEARKSSADQHLLQSEVAAFSSETEAGVPQPGSLHLNLQERTEKDEP